MSIRQYDFANTGVETGTQPGAEPPVADGDLVNKGYLEDYYVMSVPITATIANNASATSITGLNIDNLVYKGAKISYCLERKTDSSNVQAVGDIFIIWDSADLAWRITWTSNFDDELMGVTFTITSGGQVQYASDNMAGTSYVGTFKSFLMRFAL